MNPLAFYDVLQTTLDCVCAAMEAFIGEEGVPESYRCPCLQFVSAGEPEIDCCSDSPCDGGDGMLAVHLESIFPSDNFPDPTVTFAPCKAAVWVGTLVVTVARCAPGMDDHGNPRPPEELSEAGLVMALDQLAVINGLSCCLVDDGPGAKRKRRVQIGESRPLTGEGGCVSFELRAFIEFGSVCGCPEGS